MMGNAFIKATKKRSKARIAIDGPSGSGKTYTALIAATVLADGGKIAVIDTERESASLYSDRFSFDVAALDNYHPQKYIDLITMADEAGYAVIVIDSLSHAWEGEGGVLDLHDMAEKKQQTKNSYTAWKDVTPIHRKLIDAMLQSKCHIIATMRSKMDYVQEKDERTGRTVIRKIGMAPVQRAGMEYEFTVVGDMDTDHNIVISKSRCDALADKVETKPSAKFWGVLRDWLNSGEDKQPAKTATVDEVVNKAIADNTVNGKTDHDAVIEQADRELVDSGLKEPKPASNGQVKQASIKTPMFPAMIVKLQEATPYYNDSKTGKANNFHVLKSCAKIGYTEITSENIDQVLTDLIQHAKDNTVEVPAA